MWVVRDNLSWLKMLFTGGKSLPNIKFRVLFTTVLSIAVTWVHENAAADHFPELTPTPFTLIGLPLGIFLGFRNSASYDRFWEGRKLWGALVNVSRSLARQIMTVPASSLSLEAQQGATCSVAAFAHGLRARLRDEPATDAERLLDAEQKGVLPGWAAAGSSVPLFILESLAKRFSSWRAGGHLSDLAWQPLEHSLVTMADILGACERIKNTPIPYSYTVLMHRIVALYCALLPLGLLSSAKFMTPVVVFFVSYALFGLDAIGEEIEQPFGHDPNDLPLAHLCKVIETDVKTISAQSGPLEAAFKNEESDLET